MPANFNGQGQMSPSPGQGPIITIRLEIVLKSELHNGVFTVVPEVAAGTGGAEAASATSVVSEVEKCPGEGPSLFEMPEEFREVYDPVMRSKKWTWHHEMAQEARSREIVTEEDVLESVKDQYLHEAGKVLLFTDGKGNFANHLVGFIGRLGYDTETYLEQIEKLTFDLMRAGYPPPILKTNYDYDEIRAIRAGVSQAAERITSLTLEDDTTLEEICVKHRVPPHTANVASVDYKGKCGKSRRMIDWARWTIKDLKQQVEEAEEAEALEAEIAEEAEAVMTEAEVAGEIEPVETTEELVENEHAEEVGLLAAEVEETEAEPEKGKEDVETEPAGKTESEDETADKEDAGDVAEGTDSKDADGRAAEEEGAEGLDSAIKVKEVMVGRKMKTTKKKNGKKTELPRFLKDYVSKQKQKVANGGENLSNSLLAGVYKNFFGTEKRLVKNLKTARYRNAVRTVTFELVVSGYDPPLGMDGYTDNELMAIYAGIDDAAAELNNSVVGDWTLFTIAKQFGVNAQMVCGTAALRSVYQQNYEKTHAELEEFVKANAVAEE